jgi:nitroreductase
MGLLGFVRSLARLLAGRPHIPASLRDNPVLQTVLARRSVRSFAARPIPEDAFRAILEAGRLAPSTVNLQTWSFAVFDAPAWQETFARPLPFKAQRAVIVLGDMHRVRQLGLDFPESDLVDYTIAVMNASLAAMNMNLAAEALGIASVMLSETGRTGLLDAGFLKEALGLPEKVFPIMTIVFGYPQGAYPPMPPKLPLQTVCFQGRYQEADPAVMRDWLDQMRAGYKASHLNSSLEAQLQVYRGKLERAEADLQGMLHSRKRA